MGIGDSYVIAHKNHKSCFCTFPMQKQD